MQTLGEAVAWIGVFTAIFSFIYIGLILWSVVRPEPPAKRNTMLETLDRIAAATDWSKIGDVPIDLWVRYIHRGDDLDTLIASFGDRYTEAQIRAWVDWMEENW